MNRNDGTPIPDDGIPVLTDVVDVAELPPAPAPAIEAADTGHAAKEETLSLAMFPELEPGAAVELEREREPFGVDESLLEEESAASEPAEVPAFPELPRGFAEGLAAEFAAAGGSVPPPDLPALALAPPAPAAAASVDAESRSAMETRIFESLAARLDRLLDERLEPVIEGSIEAAFAGVKAGLSASLNQAMREAVEQAVRDEFEKRQPAGAPGP